MSNTYKRRSGFSFIEILIVMVTILGLAAALFSAFVQDYKMEITRQRMELLEATIGAISAVIVLRTQARAMLVVMPAICYRQEW